MPEYQKAFIGPYVNGHMELKDGFYVPFNPAQITVEEAIGTSDLSQAVGTERVGWMRKGSNVGVQRSLRNSLNYQAKNMTKLSVPLFFNTLNDLYQTSYEDVRDDIRKLYRYTNTTEQYAEAGYSSGGKKAGMQTAANKAQQIYFFWGSLAVAGMLEQMSVNYTMFAPDGRPVRAQVDISIKGFYVGEKSIAQKGSAVKEGDSGGAALSGDLSGWKEGYRGCPNPRKAFR